MWTLRRESSRRYLLVVAALLAPLPWMTTLAPIIPPAAGVGDAAPRATVEKRAVAGGATAAAASAPAPAANRARANETASRGDARTVRPSAAPPTGAPVAAASRRPSVLNRLLAPGRFAYHEMVRRAAARYRVELRLVMAIIASESGGDPSALSPAGAIGLMQLMPDTAARLGVDPWDPEQNVDGAVRYLASQLSMFKSVDLSLVAYNAGPGFAQRYRKGHVELGAETRNFLIRVGQLLQHAPPSSGPR